MAFTAYYALVNRIADGLGVALETSVPDLRTPDREQSK